MKKTRTTRTTKPASSRPLTALEALLAKHGGPLAIAEAIEAADDAADSEYLRTYERLFRASLKHSVSARPVLAIRKLLEDVDGACMLESAARNAGFAMGLEHARRLLTTPTAKGGAR